MKVFFSSIIIFILCCNTAHSQTQQGKFIVSGATNLKLLLFNLEPNTNDMEYRNVKTEDYNGKAGFGYFVADNLAIQITGSFKYSYNKKELYFGGVPSDVPVYAKDISSQITVIPSAVYFFPVEGKLKPNVSLGIGYSSLKKRDNDVTTPGNVVYYYGGPSVNVGAGLAFFLNKSVSLDLGLEYQRNKLNDKTNTTLSLLEKAYGVMTGISVYF